MPFDPNQTFDAAIVGAGLAGGSLALQLARAGAHVALVDAATFPRDKICGEFLSPESWGILHRLGLDAEITRLGYQPIRRVRLSTPQGRLIDAEFAPEGQPPGIGISRSVLDNLIVERARDAGATIIEGTRAGSPLIEDGAVVGLRGRDTKGTVEIRARVTIAADGRHSSLVEKTGKVRVRSWARPRLFGLKRHFVIKSGYQDSEPLDAVGLHLVAGGYVGTSQVENGLTNLCALLPESWASYFRGDLDGLASGPLTRNPTIGRLLNASEPHGGWKTVAGVRVEWAEPRMPGILYAGDSQGTVDPLGGQGMTMALLGAELLAPFVRSAIVKGVAEPSLQRAYRSAWEARFVRRIALCRAFHHGLIHPGFVDLASRFPGLASRVLTRCFNATRDRDQ